MADWLKIIIGNFKIGKVPEYFMGVVCIPITLCM